MRDHDLVHVQPLPLFPPPNICVFAYVTAKNVKMRNIIRVRNMHVIADCLLTQLSELGWRGVLGHRFELICKDDPIARL